MGFWSGFEGLTGHRPGAFKGFSLKDILDKDMWERRERLNQGRRFEETGVPETTNWYRGRGRPEMMGPRVGAADVSNGAQPRMGVGRDRPFPITPRQQPEPYPPPAGVSFANPPYIGATKQLSPEQMQSRPAQVQTRPYVPTPRAEARPLPAFIPGVSPTQGLDSIRQWGGGNPNQPGSMALDPTWAGGLRGAGLNAPVTPPPALDKTTVIKKSADPGVADTQTTTIKEKLDRAGLSLSMQPNQRVVPPTPPGTTDEFVAGGSLGGQWVPVNQAANWQPDAGAKAKPFWGLQDWYRDLARRRYEESMRARRGY